MQDMRRRRLLWLAWWVGGVCVQGSLRLRRTTTRSRSSSPSAATTTSEPRPPRHPRDEGRRAGPTGCAPPSWCRTGMSLGAGLTGMSLGTGLTSWSDAAELAPHGRGTGPTGCSHVRIAAGKGGGGR